MSTSTQHREQKMNTISAANFVERTQNQAVDNSEVVEKYSDALYKKFSMLLSKNFFKSHETVIGVDVAKGVSVSQENLDVLCRQQKNNGGWKDVTVQEIKSEGKSFYRFTFYR